MDLINEKAALLASPLLFTQVFYKIRTGRDFVLSQPPSRESHQRIICEELKKVFKLETNRLIINVPPGHGKSEFMIHFIAWAYARYADCQFLYVSYSHELAAKHTYTIKQVMQLPQYRKLFGVQIKHDSSAKDNFQTTAGGCVKAFGSAGAITGMDAGLPGLDRFSGGVIMDDMHKPDEVHSDTIRENVKNNYKGTIFQRPRGINVPMVFIGQRLHEDDLPANLINGMDGHHWKTVILKALDDAGNPLNPLVVTKEKLLIMKDKMPYEFSSQHQQDPLPAGGAIYKEEDFKLLDEEPEILATFITADTAETDKNYNDASVFSFWGLYKIFEFNIDTGLYGLHWLDCAELRVEPKDLEAEFIQFYADCMRHAVKPELVGIEKKSTGVTLSSILKHKSRLRIIDIERTRASGSKTARFLEIQPHVAAKRISLPRNGKHTKACITHCAKITANNSHRFDDIADTLYDAVKMGLIDKIVLSSVKKDAEESKILSKLTSNLLRTNQLKGAAYGKNR
jgi:predicted phage terminase large subunit-like protein